MTFVIIITWEESRVGAFVFFLRVDLNSAPPFILDDTVKL